MISAHPFYPSSLGGRKLGCPGFSGSVASQRSRLDDDPEPLHQTCDPLHTTHEDLYQTSEEKEQHTVSEPSDLKLANFIYDQFGEAKGVRETRHDGAPGPGREDFVLLQERDTFIPFH
ncbi:hypothetical protein E2C01_087755 [Portunus trituberculatus]|uniref:Uncharacterized protein n=1 Tax=Portunus trituberculatus TaxID=210409 RepID=A0A5B7JE78_PORTR|nr:hypothetical protein [Portunus trituberculatus]